MKNTTHIKIMLAVMILCGAAASATAQSINLWRGNETKADWNDAYKWKLKHVPIGDEAVHFRQDNCVVAVNSTVELNNGMMLYGQELSLQGNGNINLWSPIPHKSTVNIPASATGHANLTLSDNLSLNGRIALAAKAFGTSASKGSVTLKDRSAITGKLSIGNNGSGSGQVFIRDQSTYRISELELNTLAKKGGAAEIHILGGTVRLETKTNPFNVFLEDPSRKIIIGDYGKLQINSAWAIQLKKGVISKMISQKRIVAASGCQLTTPVFQRDMILIKAKATTAPHSIETLLANIEKSSETKMPTIVETVAVVDMPATTSKQPAEAKTSRLASLLKDMRTPEPAQEIADIQPQNKVKNRKKDQAKSSEAPLAGYIVFFSAALFFLRPEKRKEPDSQLLENSEQST